MTDRLSQPPAAATAGAHTAKRPTFGQGTGAKPARIWAGALVSGLVALVILLVLLGLWTARGTATAAPVALGHLLRMTALQAALSTLASLVAGIGLAWALDRLRFFGRTALIALLSAAIVTPAIVVAAGVIAVWGRAGWINAILGPLGLGAPSPFGLLPIVYAHTILDAPFAAAIFLARLAALPENRLRLGRNLRLAPLKRFLTLDLPALAPALPGLGAVIFLLSFTSFPIVLILGGGPANQTFETAIYTAIRLNFDLGAAVHLALIQLLATAILLVPATLFTPAATSTGRHTKTHWPEPRPTALFAGFVLVGLGLLLGLPLITTLMETSGLTHLFGQPSFWRAARTSLAVGALSAALALALGLTVALARISTPRPGLAGLLGLPAYVYLALPGVTLGLGFFLIVRNAGLAPEIMALPVLIAANALMTLPFALSTLTPTLKAIAKRYDRLATSLSLGTAKRLLMVEAPLLGREIGLVLAMGFGFSLGDLSVISLFGTQDFSTLPWLMRQALGAYRTNDAAAIAAILLVLAIAVFLILPPLTERLAQTLSGTGPDKDRNEDDPAPHSAISPKARK